MDTLWTQITGRSESAMRFIPACAGDSAPRASRPMRSPVHPRVCGGQQVQERPEGWPDGSSPRVRGTGGAVVVLPVVVRFILACAGDRVPRASGETSGPVHPRVCGGQTSTASWAQMRFGSSPRVRGTAMTERSVPSSMRFIPACAGDRHPIQRGRTDVAVHPRVCGGQFKREGELILVGGSSPRVRGTGIFALCA